MNIPYLGVSKMAQWARALPANLNLIPVTHLVEGKTSPPSGPLTSTFTPWHMCDHTQTQTHRKEGKEGRKGG